MNIRLPILIVLTMGLCAPLHATDLSRTFARVSDTAVVIHTKASMPQLTGKGTTTRKSEGIGSGVVISETGEILTAAHVVSVADDIMVQFKDGKSYPAHVVSMAGYADIAMLRLSELPPVLEAARLGDSSALETGEEVFVIGAPYGLEFTLTAGHFSGRRVHDNSITGESLEFLQTDAPINMGNSGGPLFDTSGRLMGIVSHIQSQSGGNQGLGFAASINMIKALLIERPPVWIGADLLPVQGEYAKALNLPQDEGLLVQQVVKGSWADEAGLMAGSIPIKISNHDVLLGGDVIVSIGGDNVYATTAGMQRVRSYMQQVPAGKDIEMTVLRGGQLIDIRAPKPTF